MGLYGVPAYILGQSIPCHNFTHEKRVQRVKTEKYYTKAREGGIMQISLKLGGERGCFLNKI
jgi:hypothetical protein